MSEIEEKDHVLISKNPIFLCFRKSIFAGIFISIGGTVYLSVGGVAGAVLFAFGLLGVIHYSLPLYTGKAGFIKTKEDAKMLPFILLGNIVGAFFFALMMKCAKPDLIQVANELVKKRVSLDIFQMLLLPVGCGIIMTTIVKFARQKMFIPLLFGIPVFILCGFIHSIADAFYYSMASFDVFINNALSIIIAYICAVIGNFIGCILPNEFLFGFFLDADSEKQ